LEGFSKGRESSDPCSLIRIDEIATDPAGLIANDGRGAKVFGGVEKEGEVEKEEEEEGEVESYGRAVHLIDNAT